MKRLSGLLTLLLFVAWASLTMAQTSPPSSGTSGALNQSTSTQGLWGAGGANYVGSVKSTAIGTPTAPTAIVGGGAAGATSYTYFCVAMDMNSSGLNTSNTGDTIPSAGTTLTTGNASLSVTNFNTITCAGRTGALGFKILKTNTATFLGSCPANSNFAQGVSNGTSCSINDTGQATAAYVANTQDQTGLVSTAAGSVRTTHSGSSNAVVSNAVANFIAIDGASVAVAAAAEGDVSEIMPAGIVFKNLQCALYTAAGVLTVAGGTNYVLAVRQNIATPGASPTCTIAAAASSCTDNYGTTGHALTTAALDQIDIIDTPTGTPTALVVKCSLEADM